MVDAGAPQMIEMLEKGDLEVAIVGVPDELPESLHQLPDLRRAVRDRAAAQPPARRARSCPRRRARQGALRQPLQLRGLRTGSRELNGRGVFLRQVFSSPRDDWVQGMIKAGLGLGFFPEFSVTDPDLVVRPLVEPSFHGTVYLATVRGRPHSPAVGAFVQEARRFPWPASAVYRQLPLTQSSSVSRSWHSARALSAAGKPP